MKVIGLTGSIAMGKSEVAKIFRYHGIPVFDADKEVHALYHSAEGAGVIGEYVPEAIVDGRVDRGKLSKAVLSNPKLLETIEHVVHAKIAQRRSAFLAKLVADGHVLAVVDVPLLFEKEREKDVDITIVVSSPQHVQTARALARPGMTPEKLEMILKRQMPDTEKRKRADIIIENDGTLEDLRRKTEAVIQTLRKTKP
jgi:dephospho-CoA kinase